MKIQSTWSLVCFCWFIGLFSWFLSVWSCNVLFMFLMVLWLDIFNQKYFLVTYWTLNVLYIKLRNSNHFLKLLSSNPWNDTCWWVKQNKCTFSSSLSFETLCALPRLVSQSSEWTRISCRLSAGDTGQLLFNIHVMQDVRQQWEWDFHGNNLQKFTSSENPTWTFSVLRYNFHTDWIVLEWTELWLQVWKNSEHE